jgi:RimJ/RimL family protein N-acetyltransferase
LHWFNTQAPHPGDDWRMNYRFAPLTTLERPAIVRHLLQLPHDDRALRFGSSAPDDAVIGYCSRWNFRHDIVEGAFADDRLVGLIHVPVYEERGDLVGEIGVSVEREARQRRIATRIAARVLERSRQRRLARVYIHFLMRNRPMMCLAARFTREIEIDRDEAQATIRLPALPRPPFAGPPPLGALAYA